jgi:hypothetical protein
MLSFEKSRGISLNERGMWAATSNLAEIFAKDQQIASAQQTPAEWK